MDAFVILALALAVMALGAVIAAGIALRRQALGLTDEVRRSEQRLIPLVTEMTDEFAVTALESEAISRRYARNVASERDASAGDVHYGDDPGAGSARPHTRSGVEP